MARKHSCSSATTNFPPPVGPGCSGLDHSSAPTAVPVAARPTGGLHPRPQLLYRIPLVLRGGEEVLDAGADHMSDVVVLHLRSRPGCWPPPHRRSHPARRPQWRGCGGGSGPGSGRGGLRGARPRRRAEPCWWSRAGQGGEGGPGLGW